MENATNDNVGKKEREFSLLQKLYNSEDFPKVEKKKIKRKLKKHMDRLKAGIRRSYNVTCDQMRRGETWEQQN